MNTTEELAQMLYDKALGELDTYLENMKTKPPQEIIGSAYQIVNKQDLLMILESAEFTPAELNVLNELDHPLQVLYEEWLPVEDRHMEELRDSVQNYLDTRLQYRAERLYADPAVPRYEGSYMEAREKGEVHLYRASQKRDRACISAFTENISDANEERRMREYVQEWTQEFGHDRCKFLLGYTIQCADWDGRYSGTSKREAAKTDYHITPERDPFSEFHTNAHPCLVNYAYELLMEQERDKKNPHRSGMSRRGDEMGYQESWLYVQPQRCFSKLLHAYEKTAKTDYYRTMGAEPMSVVILKRPFGEVPKGAKLLWVCGDRCFHTPVGVFNGNLKSPAKLRFIPVEWVLAPHDHRLEGIDLNSHAPSENAYMKRYSVEDYITRTKAERER